MSFLSKLIASIGHFFERLFKDTQDAFKELDPQQQDAILNGVKLSQIIKNNLDKTEDEIVSIVASELNISNDVATQLILFVGKNLGIDSPKVDLVIAWIKNKESVFLTDLQHNSLFESIAKFASVWLSTGKLDWVSLSMGLVEYAYQFLKGEGKLISFGGKDPSCPTGYYWNGTKCVKDVG